MEEFGQSSLRTLLSESSDAVEIVDLETLNFIDANEKACKDLGYSREELLCLRVYDIDPTVSEAVHLTVQETLRHSQSVTREGIHRRKDGSTFPVEINIKRIRLDRDYCVATVRDITEGKLARQIFQDEASPNYPEWQRHYQKALFETDRNKLFKVVEVAEAAVLTLLESSSSESDNHAERLQLMAAWSSLQAIKKDKLDFHG